MQVDIGPETSIAEVYEPEDAVDTSSVMGTLRRGKIHRPRRLVVHGVHGIGKTTFASQAPKPVFICTEDGVGDLDVVSFPVVKTFDDIVKYIKAVKYESHDFKTLVIDSIDWLDKVVEQSICEEHGVKTLSQVGRGFGEGYQHLEGKIRTILNTLDSIRDERGMNIILIAHTAERDATTEDMDLFKRSELNVSKKTAAVVSEWCDELFFATHATKVSKDKQSGKEVRKATEGPRVLYTRDKPHIMAKSRLQNIPQTIPLSWDAYVKFWDKPSTVEAAANASLK